MNPLVARFGSRLTIGFGVAASLSVAAQDLDSELALQPKARWVLEEGFEPKLLDCRLSERSDLQCVSGENLREVRCEATHFSRRSEVRSSFKGRAFSCEGTRLDKDSLMSQWRVEVRGESGSRSSWIVDAADVEQLGRLYRTEMNSVSLLQRASRPFWSVGFTTHTLQNEEGTSNFLGTKLQWGRDRWRVGGDFYRAIRAPDGEDKNMARVNGAVSLGGDKVGQGWVFEVSSGDDFINLGTRLASHCLGPQYVYNPGSWRFSGSVGNCWFPAAAISFAPMLGASAQLRVWGPVFFGVQGLARKLTGTYRGEDVASVEARGQLSVSVAVSPH